MAMTYQDLARRLRDQYPGKYDDWDDEELVKMHINEDNSVKDYLYDWQKLYEPKAEDRETGLAGHAGFSAYQFKEQFNGIPAWFWGSMSAMSGNETMGAYADEAREAAGDRTLEWLAEDPSIPAYMKWIEDEPVTKENWWHGEIFARSLAQAAPSMGTMIATDVALGVLTGGVGALVNKARTGKKFFDSYKGIKKVQALQKGVDVADDLEDVATIAKIAKGTQTAGTMSTMGVYEGAGEYSEAMRYLVEEKGLDPREAEPTAAAAAGAVGVINGIIEYMPYGRFKNVLFSKNSTKQQVNGRILRRVTDSLLKQSKVAKGFATVTDEMVKQALSEGGQEWSQHMVQAMTQYAYKNGYGDTPDTAFKHFIEQATSPEAIGSAHAGGSMGLVMGPFAGAGKVLGGYKDEQGFAVDDEGLIVNVPNDEDGGVPPDDGTPPDDGVPPIDEIIEETEDDGPAITTEKLSDNQLVLRAFVGKGISELNESDNTRKTELEQGLGEDFEDEGVNAAWQEKLQDIIENDPTAIQEFPEEHQQDMKDFIQAEFGDDMLNQVEEALDPTAVEEVEVEDGDDSLPQRDDQGVIIQTDDTMEPPDVPIVEIEDDDDDGEPPEGGAGGGQVELDLGDQNDMRDDDGIPEDPTLEEVEIDDTTEAPVPGDLKETPKLVYSQVVVKPGVRGVEAAEVAGEGINVLRKKGEQHFGNPFSSKENTRAKYKVDSVQSSVKAYEEWLRGTAHKDKDQKRRTWILEQIDSGRLDNKSLLYHTTISDKDGGRSHADVLRDFINERRLKRAGEVAAQVPKHMLDVDEGEEPVKVEKIEEIRASALRSQKSGALNVTLIGSTAKEGKGKDVDVLYEFPEMDFGNFEKSGLSPKEFYEGRFEDAYFEGELASVDGRFDSIVQIKDTFSGETQLFQMSPAHPEKLWNYIGTTKNNRIYQNIQKAPKIDLLAKEAPAEKTVSPLGVTHIVNPIKRGLGKIIETVNKFMAETEGSLTQGGKHKAVWFGEVDYLYTGSAHKAKPMPAEIEGIQVKVEQALGKEPGYYNSVLMNTLPKGVGIKKHADNEQILRFDDNTIGSVGVLSLGGESVIDIVDVRTGQIVESHTIKQGDIYELPAGDFQNMYLHAVGPSSGDRASLTFRKTAPQPVSEEGQQQLKLQRVEESKFRFLSQNKEVAEKIITGLKEKYPEVATMVERMLLDPKLREVAGLAINNVAAWSSTQGRLDTPPHEYAHVFINLMQDDPIIQQGIKEFGGDEHALVRYMGAFYAKEELKGMPKTKIAKFKRWVNKFWGHIKKMFGKPSQYIAQEFFEGGKMFEGARRTLFEKHLKETRVPWSEEYEDLDKEWSNYQMAGSVNAHGNRIQDTPSQKATMDKIRAWQAAGQTKTIQATLRVLDTVTKKFKTRRWDKQGVTVNSYFIQTITKGLSNAETQLIKNVISAEKLDGKKIRADEFNSLLLEYTYPVTIERAMDTRTKKLPYNPEEFQFRMQELMHENPGMYGDEAERIAAKEQANAEDTTAYPSYDNRSLTAPGGENYQIFNINFPFRVKRSHPGFVKAETMAWFRADNPKGDHTTLRVNEFQSDLLQKYVREQEVVAEGYYKDRVQGRNSQEFVPPLEEHNQFIQTLGKGAWDRFIVKSIIQWAASQGYEKVQFPTGKTIAVVEQWGDLDALAAAEHEAELAHSDWQVTDKALKEILTDDEKILLDKKMHEFIGGDFSVFSNREGFDPDDTVERNIDVPNNKQFWFPSEIEYLFNESSENRDLFNTYQAGLEYRHEKAGLVEHWGFDMADAQRKLQPIANRYDRLGSMMKQFRGKDNVRLVTDESIGKEGQNTWWETDIDIDKDLGEIAYYQELQESVDDAVAEITPRTARWHKIRNVFKDAWTRVQQMHKELHGDVGQRVAQEHYVAAMESRLPVWARSAFYDWASDAFGVDFMDAWAQDTESSLDYYLDQEQTDRIVGHLLNEINEGVVEVGKDLDLRYLSGINAKINVALGIVIPVDKERAWNSQTSRAINNTPDTWIENTLEEYTGLKPENLPEKKRAMLRLKYHSVRNMIRINRTDLPKNSQLNGIIVMENGMPKLYYKGSEHFMTKRTNPEYDREYLAGKNKDILWVNVNDIFSHDTYISKYTGRQSTYINAKYDPLTLAEMRTLNGQLVHDHSIVFAFNRGDSKLAFVTITDKHKGIARDSAALQEYWKAEGLTNNQIINMTNDTNVWNAAHIARYEAVKRYYPEFMQDSLDNVFKRLKIPFTPTIKANNMRDVSAKILNKENISYVWPDGTETKAFIQPQDMDPLYAGDGGTPVSGSLLKDFYNTMGIGKYSGESKNVIWQVDDAGSIFVKHLMYQPEGPVKIYENYGKDNEKLVAEVREDGDIYAFEVPKAWHRRTITKFMKDNKLENASAERLMEVFTDDKGLGIEGIAAAATKVLEKGSDEFASWTMQQKLEFIATKPEILKDFIRKVMNQSEATKAENMEMTQIDMLFTDDEAKIGTNSYKDFKETGQTFVISGQSIGHIHSSEDRHDSAPYPDQLLNYVSDPILNQLFREYILPKITDKVRTVFRQARGDSQKNIADFAEYLRRGPFNAIDNIMADMFELGAGLHRSVAGFLDDAMQTRGIEPALTMDKMFPGAVEKIQWDTKGDLAEDELRISRRNASFIFSKIAEIEEIELEDAKKYTLEEVNEWLDENEVWVLGYRMPLPHTNGAAMMRIQSIHNSNGIVFINPETIFRQFEGDGDGDSFYMHLLPDGMVESYREYYSRDEIRAKVKGVNLKQFLKKDRKKYDFTNLEDVYELSEALLAGKNGISEIAKIQRIYGQLVNSEGGIQEITVDGAVIKLRSPQDIIQTNILKEGSEHTIEEILRLYLQAAVDNGRFMLLKDWKYSREGLRKMLWVREDGQTITASQFAALNEVMDLHGHNSEIRSGASHREGKFDLEQTIRRGEDYLNYVGQDSETGAVGQAQSRSNYVMNMLKALKVRDVDQYGNDIIYEPLTTDVKFNNGVSLQEEIVLQPAIAYRAFKRAGEAGSPYKQQGFHPQVIGPGEVEIPSLYNLSHEFAIHEIQIEKEDIEITEEDRHAGVIYGNRMGNAFYNMFENFFTQGKDPGFMGWSTNPDMVNFTHKWMKEFKNLSAQGQKVATFTFLQGVQRQHGQVRFPNYLPPTSGRPTGITLLDPDLLSLYFDKYHEVMNDKENRRLDSLRDKSDFTHYNYQVIKDKC